MIDEIIEDEIIEEEIIDDEIFDDGEEVSSEEEPIIYTVSVQSDNTDIVNSLTLLHTDLFLILIAFSVFLSFYVFRGFRSILKGVVK